MDDTRLRDMMLAQLVDAFMADDQPRYRAACRWLTNYAERARARSGRVKHGNSWFDQARFERCQQALKETHYSWLRR